MPVYRVTRTTIEYIYVEAADPESAESIEYDNSDLFTSLAFMGNGFLDTEETYASEQAQVRLNLETDEWDIL